MINTDNYVPLQKEMIQIEGDQSKREWVEEEITGFLFVRIKANDRRKNRIHSEDKLDDKFFERLVDHKEADKRYFVGSVKDMEEPCNLLRNGELKRIGYFAVMKSGQVEGIKNKKYIEPIPFNFKG